MRERYRRLLIAIIVAAGLSMASMLASAAPHDHRDHHGTSSVSQSIQDVLQQLIQHGGPGNSSSGSGTSTSSSGATGSRSGTISSGSGSSSSGGGTSSGGTTSGSSGSGPISTSSSSSGSSSGNSSGGGVVNGQCGPANDQAFSSAPTKNLCSAGTPSLVSVTGPWTWICNGSNGGAAANCGANLAGPGIGSSGGSDSSSSGSSSGGSSSGGGIACDIGPPYQGSIPAPARAMGYTHCAANYDFTQPTFSRVDDWLQCPDNGSAIANNSGTALWYVEHGSPAAPCSDVNMITDGGSQVLDVTFKPTDFNNNVGNTSLTTSSGLNYPNPAGTRFPTGAYVEQVYRWPQSSFNNMAPDVNKGGASLIGGIWEYPPGDISSSNFIERDFGEQYIPLGQNGTPSNEYEWQGGAGIINSGTSFHWVSASGWNPTAYQTYGNLNTISTNGHYGQCGYFNGTPVTYSGFNGCAVDNLVHGASDSAPEANYSAIIWSGGGLKSGGNGCGSSSIPCLAPSGNVDFYIQRITIFTCPDWRTTTNGCAVSSVPSSPL
jgi:hypothetical protein